MTSRRAFVVSREYPPQIVGGTSTVARNLSTGLLSEGWDVRVVTSNPDSADDRWDEVEGVRVLRAGTNLVYNEASSLASESLRTHRRLLAALEAAVRTAGEPSVVLLPDLFCFPEARLFADRQGVPLVKVLLQDFGTLTRHDRGAHRVTSGVQADPKDLLALEGKALHGSDVVVHISHALADAIDRAYPGLATPQHVVHLGVDLDELEAVERHDSAALLETRGAEAPDAPLVVGCGRFVPVKGFDVLIEVCAQLADEGLRTNLALVGHGPDADLLRAQADKAGLADAFHLVDGPARPEALAWMAAATVAVVPSLWESFCYVCAEFMTFGRPVVATTVDSLNELVPDDRFGYRVPVRCDDGPRTIPPDALRTQLRQALTDGQAARRRGAAAADRVRAHFTNTRFAARMSSLLTDVVDGVERP
jgi:glycosyltransferase involved in cell wall biosynthesis